MRGALFFSSRYGSTERVSQWIVRRITCAETYLYQIDSDSVPIQPFDFYILGTPIFVGKPAPQMTRFIHNNKKLLCGAPVFLFITSWAAATVYKRECLKFLDLLNHYLYPCKPVFEKSLPGKLCMQTISARDRRLMQRLLRRIDNMSDEFQSEKIRFQDCTDQAQSENFGREIDLWLARRLEQ